MASYDSMDLLPAAHLALLYRFSPAEHGDEKSDSPPFKGRYHLGRNGWVHQVYVTGPQVSILAGHGPPGRPSRDRVRHARTRSSQVRPDAVRADQRARYLPAVDGKGAADPEGWQIEEWNWCMLRLFDDIIIPSKNVDDAAFHPRMTRQEQVLESLKRHNLKLHPKKCKLLQQELVFLGHRISAEGITQDENKIQRVRDWPSPRSANRVRAFRGLANYHLVFVNKFCDLAEPLYRLTEKGRPFKWTEEENK